MGRKTSAKRNTMGCSRITVGCTGWTCVGACAEEGLDWGGEEEEVACVEETTVGAWACGAGDGRWVGFASGGYLDLILECVDMYTNYVGISLWAWSIVGTRMKLCNLWFVRISHSFACEYPSYEAKNLVNDRLFKCCRPVPEPCALFRGIWYLYAVSRQHALLREELSYQYVTNT